MGAFFWGGGTSPPHSPPPRSCMPPTLCPQNPRPTWAPMGETIPLLDLESDAAMMEPPNYEASQRDGEVGFFFGSIYDTRRD